METIAIYRESIIKTYGFVERIGLGLITVDLPSERMGDWGNDLMDLISQSGRSLLLMIARPVTTATLRLRLLLDDTPPRGTSTDLQQAFFNEYQITCQIDQAVELVSFQGPHFGDRYGIAAGALKALAVQGVPLLAFACTGASVYLITPEGKAGLAREALGQAFMTPESGKGEMEV
ncbi:MAG: hypothetical protein WA974_14175 [Thermodesulfobacteriota bacterium]